MTYKVQDPKHDSGESDKSGPAVTWDYTEHAAHYDRRADYSEAAIKKLIQITGCSPGKPVADIGAGTGKLTKELLKQGLTVMSVEPNKAMREIGVKNTLGKSVTWSVGTGEKTGLPARSAHAAFFGSSFNVVDQVAALREVARILVPRAWFGCMWNHRDLEDKIQKDIESIIQSIIPSYSYGLRREDPTAVIDGSGLFAKSMSLEGKFSTKMTRSDIIVAWKSHATLRRQAENDRTFSDIIEKIEHYLAGKGDPVIVPYATRIYYAQML
jgi:ubiquinone/menaquinone biosynthesis C-methylase UbiE